MIKNWLLLLVVLSSGFISCSKNDSELPSLNFESQQDLKQILRRVNLMDGTEYRAWESRNNFVSYYSLLRLAREDYESIKTEEDWSIFKKNHDNILEFSEKDDEWFYTPKVKRLYLMRTLNGDGVLNIKDKLIDGNKLIEYWTGPSSLNEYDNGTKRVYSNLAYEPFADVIYLSYSHGAKRDGENKFVHSYPNYTARLVSEVVGVNTLSDDDLAQNFEMQGAALFDVVKILDKPKFDKFYRVALADATTGHQISTITINIKKE